MEPRCGVGSGRIAVPVAAVVGAVTGDVLALRGLRELPDLGESDSALVRTRRVLWKRASWRRRASIVDGPVDDCAFPCTLMNVFGCDHAAVVHRGDAGAVDARSKSRRRDAVDPGVNVS